ncbi:MAG: 16S rRNA (guanine(966)-N(2))-methyltransferase RsmD [Coriobacteriales bacterium]|nr:16S rRNA (guanine(966)-N(2))-methyltransferase RsmD [Actinomycetes bacterium]
MRIIAGRFRGRRLSGPAGSTTRPTADRVREAVFSTIESRFGPMDGAAVLDAFAGSGAMGLEALSRGAAHVTFWDTDHRALHAIRTSIADLGVKEQCTVARVDALSPGVARRAPERLSLLFVDPPYRIVPAQVSKLLESLAESGALLEDAIVVYEHASSTQAQWPRGFAPIGEKRYGDTSVSYAVWNRESRS